MLVAGCGDDTGTGGAGAASGSTSTASTGSGSTTTTSTATSSSTTSASTGGSLEAALEARMDQASADGFSGVVSVEGGGVTLLRSAYGVCIHETNTPCTVETVFDIGSLTKQLTAAAIMAKVDAGDLALDDPLSTFFPSVPADKADITIHQLLTHTAGMPDVLGDDYDPIDRDDFVALAFATPLLSPPGTAHAYSNVGYSILGAILELQTGESYEDALAASLFAPAGLDHTGYVLPDWASQTVAHGYAGGTAFGSPLDQPWDTDGPYWHLRANGGVLSTAPDMIAWHEALLGTAVLSDASKTAMFTPHVEEEPGSDSFYGYGWVVQDTPVGKLVWHNGGNDFFFADFWRFLDADVTVLVASNAYADYPGNDELASELAEIVLSAR